MTPGNRLSELSLSPGSIAERPKGVILLISGMFFFSIHDTIVKWISGAYPAHEIVFFRSIVALLPIILISYRQGGMSVLKTHKPILQIIRGSCWFASYTFFYLAIAALPLAEAYSLFFSSPLFITLFSVLILGEEVTTRKWLAVSFGFLGVVFIMKPEVRMTCNPAAIFAVLSAIIYAFSVVLTRRIGQSESGVSMAFYTTLIYLFGSTLIGIVLGDGCFAGGRPAGLQFLLRAWTIPSQIDIGLMALCGLLAGLGFYALAQAYRLNETAKIAPYEYVAVPLSILWGFTVWHDIPDMSSIVGTLLIVGSGLYVLREDASKRLKEKKQV